MKQVLKKYEVKYQQGSNILLAGVEAPNSLSARYAFYMEYPNTDIIDIREIGKEVKNG